MNKTEQNIQMVRNYLILTALKPYAEQYDERTLPLIGQALMGLLTINEFTNKLSGEPKYVVKYGLLGTAQKYLDTQSFVNYALKHHIETVNTLSMLVNQWGLGPEHKEHLAYIKKQKVHIPWSQ